MSNTAAFLHGARDIRVREHAGSTPAEGTVSIDIAAVGICGSDLHYYKDGGIGGAVIQSPFIPGHEFSGHLAEDAPSLGLTRGTLVAVDPATACGSCEWCHRGHPNLCPKVIFIGAPPHQGALTQTLNVPLGTIVALPEGMNADQAAMLEPLGVCIHALDLARARHTESIAIIGCGPIGLGILQVLHDAGHTSVIAVDPQAHRSTQALSMGASHAGTSLETVAEATDGRGVDLVIEATNSPNGFAHAVQASTIGGRLVLVGIPDGDIYTLAAAEARRRGLTVRFSRRMGHVYPRAIELVDQHGIDVEALISHRCGLDDTPNAFAMQADEQPGLIKSMVYPAR